MPNLFGLPSSFSSSSSLLSIVVDIVYLASFVVLFAYGQGIQFAIMQRGIKGKIAKLNEMHVVARSRFIDSLNKLQNRQTAGIGSENGSRTSSPQNITESVDRIISSFVISPIALDPSGIVPKIGQILDSADENMKSEIRRLVPRASQSEIETLSNVAEITIGLNNLYKIARHFYLLGNKPGGSLSVMQLQMMMPQIMETAEAYDSALEAFVVSKIVGDGFGPLVASTLVKELIGGEKVGEKVWNEIVKDTEVAKLSFSSLGGGINERSRQSASGSKMRTVYVVKAKGPGGNVGRPGEAVAKILSQDQGVKYIFTVDAALKLEGEETGSIAEGVGAAIGGAGVERFKIEEVASEKQIELHAIVAKMSEKEAISAMPDAVAKKVPVTASHIRDLIEKIPNEGSVIVAGIGNTLGID